MASEPAEPTTRQDPEWLAGMIAAFLSGARGMTQLKPWPEVAERLVAWLDDRGLLADPAQTTELEPDRLREELLQGVIDQDGERIKQLENEVARLRKAVQRPPHAAQVEAEERALTSARRADDTSFLLRGMARKLVAYRKWTLGDDVPAVHRLRREVDALLARTAEARIDAALAELDASSPPPRLRWIRAALQGDQPTDPKEQS